MSFRPSVPATLALALLAFLFASLGTWQTRRAAEKEMLESEHEQAPRLELGTALAVGQRFARIEVSGRYDTQHHILLDNQIWQGRSGVHVYTPFLTTTGITILVNRGWLPLAADRMNLPEIPTPGHEITINGILNEFPVPGRMIGAPDALEVHKPVQLVTYLQHADVARLLGARLESRIIQLSMDAESGFGDRDWKAVFLSAERHRAYAFQWYALLAASIILWLLTSMRSRN
jgi:surfeit locus 1 family protein